MRCALRAEALQLRRVAVGEPGEFARLVRPPEGAEIGEIRAHGVGKARCRGIQQRVGLEEVDAAVGRRLVFDRVRFARHSNVFLCARPRLARRVLAPGASRSYRGDFNGFRVSAQAPSRDRGPFPPGYRGSPRFRRKPRSTFPGRSRRRRRRCAAARRSTSSSKPPPARNRPSSSPASGSAPT